MVFGARKALGVLVLSFVGSWLGCMQHDLSAEFANEYNCPSSDVEVEELGLRRFRVTGCGRTVRYSCPSDENCIPTNESAPDSGAAPTAAASSSRSPAQGSGQRSEVETHESRESNKGVVSVEVRLDERTLLQLRSQPGIRSGATLQVAQLADEKVEACELSAVLNGQRLLLPKAKLDQRAIQTDSRILRTLQVALSPALLKEVGTARQFAVKACADRWALSPEAVAELNRFLTAYEAERAFQEPPREGGTGGLLAPVGGWPKWAVDDALAAATGSTALEGPALFKLLSPSVFQVEVTRSDGTSQGSAVAISRAELLTNCHVLDDARTITLKQGKAQREALIARSDPAGDRCVLRVDPPDLTPVRGVRAYADLQVGEPAFTLGSPNGLELSLANGILSGKRDEVGRSYIQTTAPISPGSSGGGLFDAKGNLLGITTSVLVGRENHNQSLNFAIPAEQFWKP